RIAVLLPQDRGHRAAEPREPIQPAGRAEHQVDVQRVGAVAGIEAHALRLRRIEPPIGRERDRARTDRGGAAIREHAEVPGRAVLREHDAQLVGRTQRVVHGDGRLARGPVGRLRIQVPGEADGARGPGRRALADGQDDVADLVRQHAIHSDPALHGEPVRRRNETAAPVDLEIARTRVVVPAPVGEHEERIALDGQVRRDAGVLQVALREQPVDAPEVDAEADLHGVPPTHRRGSGGAGPARAPHELRERLLERDPARLEAEGVHVRDVVADDIHSDLVVPHAGNAGEQRAHHRTPPPDQSDVSTSAISPSGISNGPTTSTSPLAPWRTPVTIPLVYVVTSTAPPSASTTSTRYLYVPGAMPLVTWSRSTRCRPPDSTPRST